MTRDLNRDGDVRTLLGMHTRTAWLVLALNALVNFAIVVVVSRGPLMTASALTGWAIVVAGGAALLLVGADPLPGWAALYVALAGPAAVALTVPFISPSAYDPHQLWMTGPVTCVLAYVCVRGRTAFGWAGMTLMVAAVMVWTAATGMGAAAGLALTAMNYAALGMATFFAYTIRPAATSIYELRSREAERAAAEATAAATVEERDRRIEQLDGTARPLLQLIADGVELTAAQRIECRTQEAHLRDGLRGTVLAQGPVVDAARAARERGVEVVLLDEGALDSADSPAARVIRAELSKVLAVVQDGSVTARVLPAGRDRLGTIVVETSVEYRRIEFDHDGAVVSVLVDTP